MRVPSRIAATLTFIFLLGAALPAEDPKPRLTVYPRVALDSGVRIEAFIPRHADNRRMGITVDGPMYRSFEQELDGTNAQVLFPLSIDRLNEGRYDVFLMIAKADGTQVTIRDSFCRGAGCVEGVE